MARTLIPRLTDIVEAIERIRGVVRDTPLEAFEADWQKQWLVERGVLIVSEASRHLTDELKARHPEIPWTKVAAIGMYCDIATRLSRRRSCGSWSRLIYRYCKRCARSNFRERCLRKVSKPKSRPAISRLPLPPHRLVAAPLPAHAQGLRTRSATRSWGETHETDRFCAGAFDAPVRHARCQCSDAIVVAAARQ